MVAGTVLLLHSPNERHSDGIERTVSPSLISNPTSDADPIPPDAKHVAVAELTGPYRHGVDGDAITPMQIHNPKPSRRAH
jgi:hypothetical protein